jgi:hypothetical protein
VPAAQAGDDAGSAELLAHATAPPATVGGVAADGLVPGVVPGVSGPVALVGLVPFVGLVVGPVVGAVDPVSSPVVGAVVGGAVVTGVPLVVGAGACPPCWHSMDPAGTLGLVEHGGIPQGGLPPFQAEISMLRLLPKL